MAQKRKRCSLSVAEKRNIINYVDQNPMTKKLDIANKFGIPASTLATILKSKDKFSEESGLNVNSERLKSCEFKDVDECVLLARTWQRVQEELHLQETDFKDFVNFDNDLAICGELTDADIVTSVLPVTNAEADEDEEEEGEIDEHNFTIKDAYNALNTIKSVFLKKGGLSNDVVKAITKLDCALDVITHTGGKQTTINDSFLINEQN